MSTLAAYIAGLLTLPTLLFVVFLAVLAWELRPSVEGGRNEKGWQWTVRLPGDRFVFDHHAAWLGIGHFKTVDNEDARFALGPPAITKYKRATWVASAWGRFVQVGAA